MTMKRILITIPLYLFLATQLFQRTTGPLQAEQIPMNKNPKHLDNVSANDEKNFFNKPTRGELEKRLSPLQCQVTQDGATERPFHNEYWDNKRPGIYVDIVSGEALFSSVDKFDSGSGWPSFTKPLNPDNVISRKDLTHGMVRIEVRSRKADSHLGHVFDDGPTPTKQRFCINSASLRFIPVESLDREGYGQYASLFKDRKDDKLDHTSIINSKSFKIPADDFLTKLVKGSNLEVATLAAGCFWGVEEILRSIKGVIDTQVGYIGGVGDKPKYEIVKTGESGHAEAVQILFDPSVLNYEELLSWYFRLHDPTTINRQGNDIGSQYRSTIFYYSEAQRKAAEFIREKVDHSGKWKNPVVTQIVKASPFWRAEEYHQDYLQKNPKGYTCHYLRD